MIQEFAGMGLADQGRSLIGVPVVGRAKSMKFVTLAGPTNQGDFRGVTTHPDIAAGILEGANDVIAVQGLNARHIGP